MVKSVDFKHSDKEGFYLLQTENPSRLIIAPNFSDIRESGVATISDYIPHIETPKGFWGGFYSFLRKIKMRAPLPSKIETMVFEDFLREMEDEKSDTGALRGIKRGYNVELTPAEGLFQPRTRTFVTSPQIIYEIPQTNIPTRDSKRGLGYGVSLMVSTHPIHVDQSLSVAFAPESMCTVLTWDKGKTELKRAILGTHYFQSGRGYIADTHREAVVQCDITKRK